MNEKYSLATPNDPDFDQPHKYTKSYGDGSSRGHCRCGRGKSDPMHDLTQVTGDPDSKRDSLGDPSQDAADLEPDTFAMGEKLLHDLDEIQKKEAAGNPEPELIPGIKFSILSDISQTIKVDKGSLILEIKFKAKLEDVNDLSHLARLIKQGGLTATIESSQIVMTLPSEPDSEKDNKDS